MAKYYPPKWCPDCGAAFLPTVKQQKVCKECAHKRKLAYSKEWNRTHREAVKRSHEKTNERRKQQRRIDRAARKSTPKPRKRSEMTWPQIIKVCMDNNISYGYAVAKGLVK